MTAIGKVGHSHVTPGAEGIEGSATVGAGTFLVAVASQIVMAPKATYSAALAEDAAGFVRSRSRALRITMVGNANQFFELLHVWQTLCSATGYAVIYVTSAFLQQVVFDALSQLGLTWKQAYCLFMVYIEAIEAQPVLLNLTNVFSHGAQDTRLRAAMQRAEMLGDGPKDDDKKKVADGPVWNGKDSPNAPTICKTYNYKGAKHPPQHLYSDGTCKHRHVCMQFVTDKGKNGRCEGNHTMWKCENPNKTKKALE